MPVTRKQASAAAMSDSQTAGTSGLKENSDEGETSTSQRDSPENCSICLGPFNNKSCTSSCIHSFCFVCLKQWSKVKAECPLCKQPFTGIFHNIRSNDNYDVYELPPANPPHQIDYSYLYSYMGGHLATFAPTQHYFSLSQPSLDADLTLSNFSRFQFGHRRYDRFLGPEYSVNREHQYSDPNSSVNPASHVSAASWPRGAEDFRLRVYRRHMGPPVVILGCENSSYHLTPAMVAASSHRLHRIMPWLTRELRVLLRSHQSVRQAIGIIQPLLTQVTIDSLYFNEKISPVIGQRSRQFIQEFTTFANSALNLQAFDRKAMYRCQVGRLVSENNSSSGSTDDDVMEVTDVRAPDVASLSLSTSTSVLAADRNCPTAGPSQEDTDVLHVDPQVEVDQVSVSSESDDPVFLPGLNDSDDSEVGSDILFVKYDKPWGKRSPIQLSSDTDGGEQSRKKIRAGSKKLLKKGSKRIRGKGKSKGKSGVSSRYYSQQETELGTALGRNTLVTSVIKQKKKHKKSKETNNGRDRNLVSLQLAGARRCPQNLLAMTGSGNASSTFPNKYRESRKKRGQPCSSDKEKHGIKKKRKITSLSALPSHKKHHTGHKRSSGVLESERIRHQHKPSSRVDISSETSSRSGPCDGELQATRNSSLAVSNVGPPVATGAFQTSYLARPDTVQHIPLNLWVSTWSSLPHTFPASSPSSNLPASSVPHLLASSSLPNHTVSSTLGEYNPQTISSESGSSSDSDSDTLPGNSSPLPRHLRTKQWLYANFPDLGHQTTASSSVQKSSSAPVTVRNWEINLLSSQTNNTSAGDFDHVAEVVSIASNDDEDVVICSSCSSEKPESDVVRVIENSDATLHSASACGGNVNAPSDVLRHAHDTAHASVLSVEQEKNRSCAHNSPRETISPFDWNTRQHLQTCRSSTSDEQSVDPSPCDIVAIAAIFEAQDPKDITSSHVECSTIEDTLSGSSDNLFKTVLSSSVSKESDDRYNTDMFPPISIGMLEPSSRTSSNTSISVSRVEGGPRVESGQCQLTSACKNSNDKHDEMFPLTSTGIFEPSSRTNSNTSSPVSRVDDGPHVESDQCQLISSTSPPDFSILSPQAPLSAPITSASSSNLNSIPNPPLLLSTSLSSMLTQTTHLLYPLPINPQLPSVTTHCPSIDAGHSQTVSTVSCNNEAAERCAKPSWSSLIKYNTFVVEDEISRNTSMSHVDGEKARNDICTSEDGLTALLGQGNKYENINEHSAIRESNTLEQANKETLQSPHTQILSSEEKFNSVSLEDAENICVVETASDKLTSSEDDRQVFHK